MFGLAVHPDAERTEHYVNTWSLMKRHLARSGRIAMYLGTTRRTCKKSLDEMTRGSRNSFPSHRTQLGLGAPGARLFLFFAEGRACSGSSGALYVWSVLDYVPSPPPRSGMKKTATRAVFGNR